MKSPPTKTRGRTLPKAIYLTGAPASGKTTLANALIERRPDVALFEYGQAMAEHLSRKYHDHRTVLDLRAGTEPYVSAHDIAEVDELMISWVQENRQTKTALVDSHQVTLESYGFRVAPFTENRLSRLRPDEIWILAIDAQEAIRRISSDPKGRRLPTPFEADLHTNALINLAMAYAAAQGIPVYILDASASVSQLTLEAERHL